MDRKITLSVFFPAFNEELNISDTLFGTYQFLSGNPSISDFEILIVDDGSTDKTASIVGEYQTKYPEVRLVSQPKNMGYGSALISGFRESKFEYVFFSDSDMQFDIKELQDFFGYLSDHDVVVGYRKNRQDNFMRILNAKGWALINWTLFGLKVRDIDCAFKLIKRDLIKNISLKSKGAMISAELLIRLKEKGARLKEVPVTHYKRVGGRATGAHLNVILQAFAELLMAYFGDLGPIKRKQVTKFIITGFINTAIDLIVYVALTRLTIFFATYFVIAKIISFAFGTVNSLFLNHYWTFGNKEPITLSEGIKFYTVVLSGLIINAGSMFILVDTLGLYDIAALFIATVLTFVWNFIWSKKWVFKN
jgi:glycosyltransferase involved in cell wall biosynthesis